MTPAEWRDLSSAELRARLVQRGVPAGRARQLVESRDEPFASREISRLLED